MDSQLHIDRYPKLWQIFIILLLTLFIIFVFGTIAFFISGGKGVLLSEAIIIIPALFFALKYNYSPILLFRLRSIKVNLLVISLIVGFSLTVISDEIDRLIQIIIKIPESFRLIYEKFLVINSISDFFIVVFSAVILAPVLEEMLFRGFLQTSLENNLNIKVAVIVTSIIFAIFHAYPWVLLQIFIIAIVMGVMAWKSNSIIPSIIVHLINNGIALIFVNSKPEQYQWYLYKGHVSIPILITAIFFAIFGMIIFFHFCKSSSTETT
jgi:membrane protease YdiL (CAAX protease family)